MIVRDTVRKCCPRRPFMRHEGVDWHAQRSGDRAATSGGDLQVLASSTSRRGEVCDFSWPYIAGLNKAGFSVEARHLDRTSAEQLPLSPEHRLQPRLVASDHAAVLHTNAEECCIRMQKRYAPGRLGTWAVAGAI